MKVREILAKYRKIVESKWSGAIEDAFFNVEQFERNRVLNLPEYEYSGHSNKNAKYIIGADIGRRGCQSVACVIKVTPQPIGVPLKTLVNIYTFDDEHFEDQAIALKKLYFKYKADRLVIDANGLTNVQPM